MVGEVVQDEDSADLSAHLLPPPHARERRETPGDLLELEPEGARRRDDAERVLDVVGAAPGQGRDPERAAALPDGEAGALRTVDEVARGVVGAGSAARRDPLGAR